MQNAQSDPLLIFDFCDDAGQPRSLRFADPVEIIVAYAIDEVMPALEAVQRASDAGMFAAGYVAYEAAPAFDSAFTVRAGTATPLVWFGVYREPETRCVPIETGAFEMSPWLPEIARSAYDQDIAAIHAAIARGVTYQVNHTMRLRADFHGDDLAFYQRLRAAQRAAYCAYLRIGALRILSVSPELFFRRSGDKIEMRPMKGTMTRGRFTEEDTVRIDALEGSDKHRAENVMIVDLLRSDLGRVAEMGTVHVPSLFEIERYRTVFQMTSTVKATLRPNVSLADIFKAVFPCGSVTGAPKISTMRQIAGLETTPRQAYCGAVGFVRPGSEAVFNVAIRTVQIDAGTGAAEFGVGGGITWDSTASEEYEEMLSKAAFLEEKWPAFELLETLLLEDGAYTLLTRHLDRLAASVNYFDIPLEISTARAALDALARDVPAGRLRVRLLAAQDGGVRLEHYPLGTAPESPVSCALAKSPVSRNNRFLFHKTTNRSVYEAHKSLRKDVFDVLLWNEEAELTEFTIGNLVIEKHGIFRTPPRDCGLLAGTLRAELLATGRIEERVITRADLETAERVWFINSVRGWIPVKMVE